MVITGAPNLSNEAGVREEVRSVSARGKGDDVRRMRIRKEIGARTKCWSCRERVGDGDACKPSSLDPDIHIHTLTPSNRDTLKTPQHHFSLPVCCNSCGMQFIYLFLEGVYI